MTLPHAACRRPEPVLPPGRGGPAACFHPSPIKAYAARAAIHPRVAESTPRPKAGTEGSPRRSRSPPARRRVNTSAKGTAIELAAIKLLESEGYKVHRCVRTGVKRGPNYYSQSNDVFGCIDLIGKKRGERTRWIQVTAHSGIGQKKDDLAQVPWDPLFDCVEIWRWVGGQARKHKSTGEMLERQYFQIYSYDDEFRLDPTNRRHLADRPDQQVALAGEA